MPTGPPPGFFDPDGGGTATVTRTAAGSSPTGSDSAASAPFGPGSAFGPGNGGNGGDGANGFAGQFAGQGFQQGMRLVAVHGGLAAVAFVALFPLGAILMRVVTGRLAWKVHAAVQMLGYLVYIIGAAIGLYLVRQIRIPNGQGGTGSLVSGRPLPNSAFLFSPVPLFAPCVLYFSSMDPVSSHPPPPFLPFMRFPHMSLSHPSVLGSEATVKCRVQGPRADTNPPT